MIKKCEFAMVLIGCFCSLAFAQPGKIENPSIDIKSYLKIANEAAKYRESRRLSEDAFIKMSQLPGVIVLDARSKEKYDELHVKGALNLSFPDIAVASLGSTLPDKNAVILIYCNNNFTNAERAFPSKVPAASLNISTYISLYTYGYRNVYELGPLLDLKTSKIEFESTVVKTSGDERVTIDQFE
jgi:hypothetical protein